MLIVLLSAIALMVLLAFEQPMRELYGSVSDTVEDATSGRGNGSGHSSCGAPPCGKGPDGGGPPGGN